MEEKISCLKKYIENSHYIVFFGGAGVSTESGIPDFRSKDGLYNQKYDFPPEKILSYSFFLLHPYLFYKFYREKMNTINFKPNITHYYLTELESCGKLKAIITQNIDGLHQKAGSKNVIELHGSIYENYCMKCHKKYKAIDVFQKKGIPACSCGGIIKPNVTLYEEALQSKVWEKAISFISKADLFIIAGTSLTVYPANLLVSYFKGKHLVIINDTSTDFDPKAHLVIHDKLGNVIKKMKKV